MKKDFQQNINGYNLQYTDNCLYDRYKNFIKNCNYYKEKTLKVSETENVFFLPLIPQNFISEFLRGGIFYENGQMVEESKLLPNRVYRGYNFNPENALYDDREVIFAGCFWSHWGHFILEQVSRLWYFLDESDSSMPIVYLADKPLEGNYQEFFELLGIDTKRLIWVNKLTKFKKVYIPDVSMIVNTFYTKEYKTIFEKVKSNVNAKNDKKHTKIFLSRRDFFKAKNRDFGQIKEIEKFFENDGYKIISPERLSLKEQISLLKSCKELVSISGTLPHNLLFSGNQLKKIIILNRSALVNVYQWLIDDITGMRPLYIDIQLSLLPQQMGDGPFFFVISDNLVKYADDIGRHIEKKDFTEDLKLYLSKYIFKTKYRNLPFKIFWYYFKQVPDNKLMKIHLFLMQICYPYRIIKTVCKYLIKVLLIIQIKFFERF